MRGKTKKCWTCNIYTKKCYGFLGTCYISVGFLLLLDILFGFYWHIFANVIQIHTLRKKVRQAPVSTYLNFS